MFLHGNDEHCHFHIEPVLSVCLSLPVPYFFCLSELAREKVNQTLYHEWESDSDVSATVLKLRSQMVIGGILSPVADAYGKVGLLSASDRVEMTRVAIASDSDSWLAVDCWESGQPQWSRTLSVLAHVQTTLDRAYSVVNHAAASTTSPSLPHGEHHASGLDTSILTANPRVGNAYQFNSHVLLVPGTLMSLMKGCGRRL